MQVSSPGRAPTTCIGRHERSSTTSAPGETAEFELIRKVGLDDVDCHVTDVTGPLPFGLDIET